MSDAKQAVLQMKYARIIKEMASLEHISLDEAANLFYNSPIFELIQEGVGNLHCLSDKYLAQEIVDEAVPC